MFSLAWKLIPLGNRLPSRFTAESLRPYLKFIGHRLYSSSQHDQLDDNIDFITTLAQDLCAVSKDKKAYAAIKQSFDTWDRLYFNGQQVGSRNPAFVTYTEEETQIPFSPHRDHDYASLMTMISHVGAELVKKGDREKVIGGIHALDSLHELANATFTGATSCMARYTDHDRISLGVVQKHDAPVNCAPSLHVADSLLLYNMVKYWNRHGAYDELERFTHDKALDMIPTVLDVKQHSLTDVACGMLAAQMVCDKIGIGFDDLSDPLSNGVRERHPHVPFDQILINLDQLRYVKRHESLGDLRDIVLAFYEARNFPITGPGEYNFFVGDRGEKIPYEPRKVA